jgi:hypothetical protein
MNTNERRKGQGVRRKGKYTEGHGTPFDGAQDKQMNRDERGFPAALTKPAENPECRVEDARRLTSTVFQ